MTGLNAFQNCSPEEFRSYIAELAKKKVSALVIKQGRTVDFMEEKDGGHTGVCSKDRNSCH